MGAAILFPMANTGAVRWKVFELAAASLLVSLPLLCESPTHSIRIDDESLLSTDPADFVRSLALRRPDILSATARQQVLDSLPAEGEIKQLTFSDRSSLASLEPVLRVHGRESIYAIKVFSAHQMFVGLHARMVLLISSAALRLMTPVELQAVVAHEIGHEYVWDEYARADQSGAKIRLRELELYCDAIAAVTLQQIGVNPSVFPRAIRKVSSYNRIRFGAAKNEDSYPRPEDRLTFDEAVTRWATRLAR